MSLLSLIKITPITATIATIAIIATIDNTIIELIIFTPSSLVVITQYHLDLRSRHPPHLPYSRYYQDIGCMAKEHISSIDYDSV